MKRWIKVSTLLSLAFRWVIYFTSNVHGEMSRVSETLQRVKKEPIELKKVK